MPPRIETLPEKKLVGKRLTMAFSNNRNTELWSSFMPRLKTIKNRVGRDLISLQVYPEAFNFNPQQQFEKWAAVEVESFEDVLPGMETFLLEGGLYAVFHYPGLSSDTRIFRYIFATWLPASDYRLDNRPHFEILGEKYRNNHPDSEEEIWIPVTEKR